MAAAELNEVPRTLFDDDPSRHHDDQIAWFADTDHYPPWVEFTG